MPDVEKVIKGLGEALTLLAEYVPCEGYLGYAPGACLDAIDLLKAQEPRVMTLDEYRAIAERPLEERVPVWLEWRDRRGRWTIPERAYEGYGVDWRCWTSRPTDEQREATPWE